MSDEKNKIPAKEKLEKLIEQKTNENEALKKLLEKLNQDVHATTSNNLKKKK